ncbi:hypothetical protein JTF04_11445 [Mammaliicoccus vitulinus]|uniref:phage tail assembly chaperone GT n=1 Tax=Mammaliicoccus vitulinus TaxID=71237 RepID=UPI00194FC804|nr:hypothetical protein [Mammaliicoccus vitulinus]MBM6630300.1 hypothetical protein [Mammaliicoccus vitulinus]
MKNNSIELITEFSDTGEPLRTETYLTRPTVKLVMVYECVSFLALLKDTPNTNEVQQMIDLVVRIYDEQFSKHQLIDGLPSHKAVPELYQQIVFIASGNQVTDEIDDEVKKDSKVKSKTVSSWKEYKGHLNDLIKDMTKEGKDINEVLNLPYAFMMTDLSEDIKKVKRTESMLDAFQ